MRSVDPSRPTLGRHYRIAPKPDALSAALQARVSRGLGWSLLNNLLNRLGSIASGVVLARILVPEDYGVFAVALVVLNAILSVNELGVSLAVVRWPGRVDAIAPTVATMSIVSSAACYAGCYLLAPTVADALHAPSAAMPIRLLSVCVLFDGVAAVPAALITREFAQRLRTMIDLASFVVGSGLSVVLAVSGFGAWSMIWGFVASNFLAGCLTVTRASRWYAPGWNREVARQLVSFGAPLAGSSLLMFAMLNADYVVVGRVLGARSLGVYLLAFNMSAWPAAVVSSSVRRVSMAAFSRLAETPTDLGRSFARATGLLLAVTLPITVLMVVYAHPLVAFAYGAKWHAAAHVLQLLCVLGAVRVFTELAYDYLVALAHTRANLGLQLLWTLCLIPALVAGAHWHGVVGVAAAHALVAGVIVVPAYLVTLARLDVRPRRLLANVTRPVIGSVLVSVSAVVVLRAISGNLLQLLVGGVVAVAVYLCVVHPARNPSVVPVPGPARPSEVEV